MKRYLSLPNHIVIAATRTPATAEPVAQLPHEASTKLLTRAFNLSSPESVKGAISSLSNDGISHLDVVIACGALNNVTLAPISTTPPEQVLEHFKVNALGTLNLFQATWPLLKQNDSQKKFVLLGSPIGSISEIEKRSVPMDAYGISKAAAHYIVRKAHVEQAADGLVAFAVDPGFLQSKSGNATAKKFGMEKASTPLDDSAAFVISTVS